MTAAQLQFNAQMEISPRALCQFEGRVSTLRCHWWPSARTAAARRPIENDTTPAPGRCLNLNLWRSCLSAGWHEMGKCAYRGQYHFSSLFQSFEKLFQSVVIEKCRLAAFRTSNGIPSVKAIKTLGSMTTSAGTPRDTRIAPCSIGITILRSDMPKCLHRRPTG